MPSKFDPACDNPRQIRTADDASMSETKKFRTISASDIAPQSEKTIPEELDASQESSASLVGEFLQFAKENKSWCMIPILACMGILGAEFVLELKRQQASQQQHDHHAWNRQSVYAVNENPEADPTR